MTRGEGVQKSQIFAEVICERPLAVLVVAEQAAGGHTQPRHVVPRPACRTVLTCEVNRKFLDRSPVEAAGEIVEAEAPVEDALQVAALEPRQLGQHQPHLLAGAGGQPRQRLPLPAGAGIASCRLAEFNLFWHQVAMSHSLFTQYDLYGTGYKRD